MIVHNKALFIAEGVTLAHVGRSIRLASILHRDGIDVELACDDRYARFLAGLDFPLRSIRSIPSDRFLDALAQGMRQGGKEPDVWTVDCRPIADYAPPPTPPGQSIKVDTPATGQSIEK